MVSQYLRLPPKKLKKILVKIKNKVANKNIHNELNILKGANKIVKNTPLLKGKPKEFTKKTIYRKFKFR